MSCHGMKALTIWQPWASLIMAGDDRTLVKHFEFRRWAPRWPLGIPIVCHAAAKPVDKREIVSFLNQPTKLLPYLGTQDDGALIDAITILDRWWQTGEGLPLGVGLGTLTLGLPRKAADIFAGILDPDDIDPDIWGWPIVSVTRWGTPVPMRGFQGFWNWPGEA